MLPIGLNSDISCTDPVITPEMFAQTIVDDYGLAQNFHSVITKAIQDQLSDFQAHSHLTSGDGTDEKAAFVRKGTFAEEDAKWWKQWRAGAPDRARAARGASPRKRRKVDIKLERNIEDGVGAIALDEEPLNLDGFEFDEGTAEDDMRIVIRVCYLIVMDEYRITDLVFGSSTSLSDP
jgi:SWI/SNF-related matrix-associated actin-dependent regulator of chromatin subfamily B protein 1